MRNKRREVERGRMRAGDRRRGWKVRHRGDAEGGGEGKGLHPTGALRSGIRALLLGSCGDSKSASSAKCPKRVAEHGTAAYNTDTDNQHTSLGHTP